MAWNGSDNKVKSIHSQPQPSTSTSNLQPSTSLKRGALAGLIVVALASAGVWWFAQGTKHEAQGTNDTKHDSRIAEAQPEIATNGVAVGTNDLARSTNATAEEKDAKPRVQMGVGARVVTNAALRARGKAKVFKHKSERAIASLLTAEYGTPALGEPHFYGSKFEKDVEAALNEPIEYDKNDDPETAKLKIAVQQVKDELKERRANGENICDILMNAHRELQDLAAYKTLIKRELKANSLKPGMTEQDLDDFVSAANQMLEKKGIAPIEMSNSTRLMLRNRTKEL